MQKPLTVQETAREVRLSQATIYRLIRRGEAPCHKIADRYFFYPDDLELLLKKTAIGSREGVDYDPR
jgi:excisionase family DNA binding protein